MCPPDWSCRFCSLVESVLAVSWALPMLTDLLPPSFEFSGDVALPRGVAFTRLAVTLAVTLWGRRDRV